MALAAPSAARLTSHSSSSSADVPSVETSRRRRRHLNATAATDPAPAANATLSTPPPSTSPTATPPCPGPWSNGTAYVAGDAVSSSGIVFACGSPDACPSSEPMDDASTGWMAAWSLGGYCEGTFAPTSSPSGTPTGAPTGSPSFDVLAHAGGCPAPWANGTSYSEGDAVSTTPGVVFACTGWPTEDCGSEGPLDAASDAWRDLWTPKGYCEGTMSPTPAPTNTDGPTTEMIKTVRQIEPEEKSCYTLLDAIADDRGQIDKDGYFVFVDEMSNGYYTVEEGAQTYSDLPFEVKYSYVTLACQCITMGGRVDCCQGPRARLNVTGVDDPDDASPQVQAYLEDICVTTSETITVAPDRGELPTTAPPSTSLPPTPAPTPSPSKAATESPTPSPFIERFEVIPPAKEPSPGGGVSISPIAGFGIALACVAGLVFAVAPFAPNPEEKDEFGGDDDDLSAMERDDALKGGGEGADMDIAAGDTESCTTAGLTGSRSSVPASPSAATLGSSGSSIPSADGGYRGAAASDYYASNPLLPAGEDEDASQVSSLQESDESNMNTTGFTTVDDTQSSASLDQAIESGDWERVAASAARAVGGHSETGVEV